MPIVHPDADLDRLGTRIAELSAHIQAATYRLLVLIREFDDRGGWNRGFRSCAHWLNWRTGLDLGAAREKVRVARTLHDLPQISSAMERGELSYSKVRALTRVATPENERDLLQFALTGTAAHVERLARAWRRVDRYEAMAHGERLDHHRHLRTFTDEDGMLVVHARLAPEVGALFSKALEVAMEGLYKRSREDEASAWSEVPAEQRRADALELVADSALAGVLKPATVGDRYQLVVHVSPETLTAPAPADTAVSANAGEPTQADVSAETSCQVGSRTLGIGELENGVHVSAETSQRLACEASRVVMTHGPDGSLLDVGRKTRAVHPAMRRALNNRDGGCRFPGCGVQRCDAHHVEHWAEGGETKLDNLLLLCRFHHRALHEGGFRVELDADGEATFYHHAGAPILNAPAPPPLANDPVAALAQDHRSRGLLIDGFTGFPLWQGEILDLNLAIDAMLGGGKMNAGR